MNSSIKIMQDALISFREARNWRPYHNPKDLAVSICLEAAEVLEHFKWQSNEVIASNLAAPAKREAVGEELCDVLNSVLLLALELGVDLEDAFFKKLEKNAMKHPAVSV